MNEVRFRPVARLRVIDDRRLPQVQRRLERPRDDLLLQRSVLALRPSPPRVRFGGDDARQLIEELAHVRRQRRGELFERALDLVAERRARQRFEQRAAEIQRAQLGQRQPGREPLERLAVDLPPRPPVVSRSIVVRAESPLPRAPADRGGWCAS